MKPIRSGNNIEEFKKQFSLTDKDIVSLDVSFRSTNKILRVAHTLIEKNYGEEKRQECLLLKNHKDTEGEHVSIIETEDDNEEARAIVENIENYLAQGIPPKEIAILGYCNNLIIPKTYGKVNRKSNKVNMELSDAFKIIFTETAQILKNSHRRIFMARVVNALGKGGQSQTDPTFKTTRLYTRLSSAEVRQQLIEQKGYKDFDLPTDEIIRQKLQGLGYRMRSVQKSQPKKKIPQTDAIFDQLSNIHTSAKNDETVLRISIDAKATVLVGPFSRGGKSWVTVRAADHDFQSGENLTPIGIFLPEYNDIKLYFSNSHITSDFIVDCMNDFWSMAKQHFPYVKTLLVNLDNGPENNSRRTQFMNRLTEFADEFQIDIQLAYYPPYHSKYNPIERVWGVLEQHWNGSLLDTKDAVIKLAQTMKWNGNNPIVKLVERSYQTGVSLTQKAMALIEKRLERLEGLEKWFVKISHIPTKTMG